MRLPATLPSDFETWTFEAGVAAARHDLVGAVRDALAGAGSLYAWAAAQPDRRVFIGRGAAYGVTLGPERAVVRHARRGGLIAPFLGDRFLGTPRVWRELALSARLLTLGIPTPEVLAAVVYGTTVIFRADVATTEIPGEDLAAIFFGREPPAGPARRLVLEEAARLVRRLHDARLVHPDLQLRNILVRDWRGPEPKAFLLDVDTCRTMGRDGGADARRNLQRFYRSWDKWNRLHGERLTASDRAAFEARYEGRAR